MVATDRKMEKLILLYRKGYFILYYFALFFKSKILMAISIFYIMEWCGMNMLWTKIHHKIKELFWLFTNFTNLINARNMDNIETHFTFRQQNKIKLNNNNNNNEELTFWHRNYFFFLILEHIVYKMWIIQGSNTLELWNKLHFEENKTEMYIMFKIFSNFICWINI